MNWISVKDRLPELTEQFEDDNMCFYYSEKVLIFHKGGRIDVGYLCEAGWANDCFDEIKGITHWMPLPEPPKEG